jgi:hypothetical protein
MNSLSIFDGDMGELEFPCLLPQVNIPLYVGQLTLHKSFSPIDTPSKMFAELEARRLPRLCMWHNVEGVNDTNVYFLTGRACMYDDKKMAIVEVEASRYQQIGVHMPVYTTAKGYMAMYGNTYMLLDHPTLSWHNVSWHTLDTDAKLISEMSAITPDERVAGLLAPFAMRGMIHARLLLPRATALWLKSYHVTA